MKAPRLARKGLVIVMASIFGMAGIAAADYSDTIEVIGKSNVDVKSATVSYADLNVTNEQGAGVLYRRLQQASSFVCDVAGSMKSKLPEMTTAARRCYNDTLARSVSQINKATLTRIHEGQ